MEKKHQFNVGYALLAFAAILLFQSLLTTSSKNRHVAYSEFLEMLERQQLSEVIVRGERVEGILKTPSKGQEFVLSTRVQPELARELPRHQVKFRATA